MNAVSELIIFKMTAEGGGPLPAGATAEILMKEQLPMTPVCYMEWDPSSESTLAIGLRGFGIALWKADSGVGCQMWAGMGEARL